MVTINGLQQGGFNRPCINFVVYVSVCIIISRLFTEINTAQPVNIIDLPDMATAGEKDIINRAADMLRLEFPNMFSPSINCRIPNINVDNLRDEVS